MSCVADSRAECRPPLKVHDPLALLGIILLNAFEILNECSLDLRGMPLTSSHSADVRAVNSHTAGYSAVDATKRVNEATYSLERSGVTWIGHCIALTRLDGMRKVRVVQQFWCNSRSSEFVTPDDNVKLCSKHLRKGHEGSDCGELMRLRQ